jgi:hypothetical protein
MFLAFVGEDFPDGVAFDQGETGQNAEMDYEQSGEEKAEADEDLSGDRRKH